MILGQYDPPSGQQHVITMPANHLLRQHPVLIPVLLIGAAIGLCVVSFSAETLFPLLTIMGTSSILICLLVALVLGIAGVLAAIISIIENIDRARLPAEALPPSKEGV